MFTWRKNRWRNLSVTKKLYAVVGLMAILIASELFTLLFAMTTLSSVRAFVMGEGLWTKAQKNAFQSLYQYALTGEEMYFRDFKQSLTVQDGDHVARIELSKPRPNRDVVREGFLTGQNDAGDVDGMIDLLLRFSDVSYIREAISAWTKADSLLGDLRLEAERMHATIVKDGLNSPLIRSHLAKIAATNAQLTVYEKSFSEALSEGSRWLENVLMILLVIVVATVESTGLFLTFRISRYLSRSLKELKDSATAIGQGDFTKLIPVRSRDELGQLAESLNDLTRELRVSYRERDQALGSLRSTQVALQSSKNNLESRVDARTSELKDALTARDEFLSIASHELKTPLTSLKLQLDSALRSGVHLEPRKAGAILESCLRQANLMRDFIDDLMDVSRIRAGKFVLRRSEMDLCELIREVLSRFSSQLAAVKMPVELRLERPLKGVWDRQRLAQVLSNLISNAIKYAPGRPLLLMASANNGSIRLLVEDHGPGINKESQTRIFDRYERMNASTKEEGLGLGLYIVRQIIEAHHGRVFVDSEIGKGSRFFVELPRMT